MKKRDRARAGRRRAHAAQSAAKPSSARQFTGWTACEIREVSQDVNGAPHTSVRVEPREFLRVAPATAQAALSAGHSVHKAVQNMKLDRLARSIAAAELEAEGREAVEQLSGLTERVAARRARMEP